MQETQVWSQGWEDPLEKEMATHSIILAWRIPWTEGPGGLQSMGSQKVGHDWANNTGCKLLYIGWIHNKVLLHSIGNYIQRTMINHNGKEYDKITSVVCVYGSHSISIGQHCSRIPALLSSQSNLFMNVSKTMLLSHWKIFGGVLSQEHPSMHDSWGLCSYFSHAWTALPPYQFSSVSQSYLTLSPNGLQHVMLPCLSPTPGACSNLCPLSWWCHPTISSSVIPFSSCFQSFPESGSFPMNQFFASGGQSIGASASASVLQMNIQDWFPLGLTIGGAYLLNSLWSLSKCYLPNEAFPEHPFWNSSICSSFYLFGSFSLPQCLPPEDIIGGSSCDIIVSVQFKIVQFSRSVVSDSLQPHEPQHARPPCPSPTPGVHPNPCPLSRWSHPTILSSVVPFLSCPQPFPASGSFQMSQLFTSGGQNIGVSASTSVLPMNTQDWSPLGWIGCIDSVTSSVFLEWKLLRVGTYFAHRCIPSS